MPSIPFDSILARARVPGSRALTETQALALAELPAVERPALLAAAAGRRDAACGRRVTYSPKVFLPLTNLCRNRCGYCSFRRSPGEPGEWTMTPLEVEEQLARAQSLGCVEALFCVGDKPERAFSSYRAKLASLGRSSTVDYLWAVGHAALERSLLPHTNAGVLDGASMRRLAEVNPSLGLMLETVSERLSGPGMPHQRAPDKHPARRLAMIDEAGALGIPFTTGVLVGIGETRRERVEALLAIRALHRRHGHVQEVIVQPFRAHPATPMAGAPELGDDDVAECVALARVILDDEVSVQAPPNLNAGGVALLLAAGINDFGGVSPLTPDYVNPRHPWPHLVSLSRECVQAGFTLRPRLPVYDRFLDEDGWVHAALREQARAVRVHLESLPDGTALAPMPPATPSALAPGLREGAPRTSADAIEADQVRQ